MLCFPWTCGWVYRLDDLEAASSMNFLSPLLMMSTSPLSNCSKQWGKGELKFQHVVMVAIFFITWCHCTWLSWPSIFNNAVEIPQVYGSTKGPLLTCLTQPWCFLVFNTMSVTDTVLQIHTCTAVECCMFIHIIMSLLFLLMQDKAYRWWHTQNLPSVNWSMSLLLFMLVYLSCPWG